MSRLFTVLNYFCIAICAVGIYSSYRLLSLKPWKVEDLDIKLVAQLDKWQAPSFDDAEMIERSLGEKKLDAISKENVVVEPTQKTSKSAVIAEAKEAAVAADVAKIAPTKLDSVEVEPEKTEPAPKAVKIAKVAPVVAEQVVETPKIAPKPQPKKETVVVQSSVKPDPKKADPVSNVKSPVVPAAPEVVKTVAPAAEPEPMLLADATPVKAPKAADDFPETNTQNTTQTRISSTEKPPLREKETTQTKSEKTTPVLGKKSPTISLSSMLEVDKGAVAPR